MAKLHRVKTDSLRTQIYVQLKNQLMDGAWKLGEKLPSENQLCETFGVSRVTVRAAIQQLEILGLVETRHGGGSYVGSLSAVGAMDSLHPSMAVGRNQDIITVLDIDVRHRRNARLRDRTPLPQDHTRRPEGRGQGRLRERDGKAYRRDHPGRA